MEEVKTQVVEQKKPLPKLIKQSATYKLIVPEKVEEKIRYLIRKFPHTEWSGVLFYSHTGTFEKNDLVVTCEDIYPMDLGSGTFTEFKMTSDVAHYMSQNIELFDCEIGNVHSHHTMGAFFSGTDESTLREGGNETNCWLMLIVDTRGQYVARITRKVKAKKEITTKDLGSSYEFFGEGEVKLGKGDTTKQSVEEDVIEYYDLNVERHEVHNPLASLDERFDEIEAKKNPHVPSNSFNTPVTQGFQDYLNKKVNAAKDNFYDLSHPWEARKQKVQEPFLWDDATMNSITDEDAVFANWQPDRNLIHAAVCKMISCSLILNVERFDMRQWITRHMNNVYERIFPETDKQDLQEWLEFIVDFSVYHFVDPSAPQGIGDEWYFGQIANAMIEELTPYDDVKYPYIKPYIDQLSTIIV